MIELTDAPVAGTARRRMLLVAGAVVVAVVLSLVFRAVSIDDHASWMYDMKVFRKAGGRALDGQTFYWPSPRSLFTHPPFNALLFAVFSLPSLGFMAVVWNAVTLFCLQVLTWLMLEHAGVTSVRVRAAVSVAVAVLVLWFDPLRIELLLGQINVLCYLALFIDLVVLRGRRWQGLLTGMLAGIFLVPGFFAVYLLLTKRIRAFWCAVGAFAVTVAVGAALRPGDSWTYWSGLFLDSRRVGSLQNPRAQALQDVLARFLHTDTLGYASPVLVVVTCLAGLALAVRKHRAGAEVAAVLICGLTVLVASPISWNHQFVWVVPILVILSVAAVRRRSVVLAVVVCVSLLNFFLAPYTMGLPVDSAGALHLSVWQCVLASTYLINVLVLGLVVFFVQLPGDDSVHEEFELGRLS